MILFSLLRRRGECIPTSNSWGGTVSIEDAVYDGSPHGTVVLSDTPIIGDYQIRYLVNGEYYTTQAPRYINAGTYTIEGKIVFENYSEYPFSCTFTISKATPSVSVQPVSVTYNGQAISAPTVTTDSDGGVTYTYYKDGVVLQGAPVDAGSYTVVVETLEGDNYLEGRATGTITINKVSLRLVWSGIPQQYTGSMLSPSVYIASVPYDQISVSVSVAGEPINVGTYACTATLTGAKADNYEIESGYETNTLTITKMQIVASLYAFTYDGTDKWPSNTDYVTYSGAGTAIDAGTYQVTASLNDTQNTEWSDHTTADKTLTLIINAASIDLCTVTGIDASYNFTGSDITPIPTVTFGGFTLFENTDYTVSYSDNVNVGTAYVTITGIGNFTGTTTVTFVIAVSVLRLADPNDPIRFAEVSGTNYTLDVGHTLYDKRKRIAIYNVPSKTTVGELIDRFDESQRDRITVYNASNGIVAEGNYGTTFAATGFHINLYDANSKLKDSVYVCVVGDITKDGLISAEDQIELIKVIQGRVSASNELYLACDINKDGVVNSADLAALKAKINGTSDFEADY